MSRINAIAMAELMLGLQDGCHTMIELGEMSGLSMQTVRRYLKMLHKRHVIHVADWREDAKGGRTLKVYALGTGTDMPRPKPMPQKVICARYRARKRQERLMQLMASNSGRYEVAA